MSKTELEQLAKACIFIVLVLMTYFFTPRNEDILVSSIVIGKISFLISMLYALYGRGVLASNIGMALMTLSMILLLA